MVVTMAMSWALARHPVDERAVDLHRVDRQPRDVAQGRIAGAEVVHGDVDTQAAQDRKLADAGLERPS